MLHSGTDEATENRKRGGRETCEKYSYHRERKDYIESDRTGRRKSDRAYETMRHVMRT